MRKFLPKVDKLEHYYIGSFIFIACSIVMPNWLAVVSTAFVAVAWELYREYFKGIRSDYLDVFYSVLLGLLITIKELI